MDSKEAESLGYQIEGYLLIGDLDEAESLLYPVLSERIPFSTLDKIGQKIGGVSLGSVELLSYRLADGRKMGSWVIIASALSCHFPTDIGRVLADCRAFIIQAAVWYATDTFGERVVGPASLVDFHSALQMLAPWRGDSNRWVRRCVGVAVHLWAKRTRGQAEMVNQALDLLHFLEPVFEEKNQDAVKGIGWGLKTMGRYYPELAAAWLDEQVNTLHRQPRPLMLRKALTYLPPEQKLAIAGR